MKYLLSLFLIFSGYVLGAEDRGCENSKTLTDILVCRYPDLKSEFLINRNRIEKLTNISKEKGLDVWWSHRSQSLDFSFNYAQECGVWMTNNLVIHEDKLKCIKNNVNEKNKYLKELIDRKVYKDGFSIQKVDLKEVNKDLYFKSEKIDLINISIKQSVNQSGLIPIKIDRPNKDVILVLCSEDRDVLWELDISSRTKIDRVYLCLSNPTVYFPSVVIVSNRLNTIKTIPLYVVRSEYDSGFYVNLTKFKEYFNVSKVDYFHAAEYLSGPIIVNDKSVFQEEWSLEPKYSVSKINDSFVFKLLNDNFEYVNWSVSGPLIESSNMKYVVRNVAFDSKSGIAFRYLYGNLQVHENNGAYRNIVFPENYPQSKVIDIAYSEGNSILYVLFERFIYRYDVKSQKWLKIFFIGNSLKGLAIDSSTDQIALLKENAELTVISSENGKRLSFFNLNDYFPEYSRLKRSPIRIFIDGDRLVIVRISGVNVTHIWYGNMKIKKFYLTYRNHNL